MRCLFAFFLPLNCRAQKLASIECSRQEGLRLPLSSMATMEISTTLKCGQRVTVLDRSDNVLCVHAAACRSASTLRFGGCWSGFRCCAWLKNPTLLSGTKPCSPVFRSNLEEHLSERSRTVTRLPAHLQCRTDSPSWPWNVEVKRNPPVNAGTSI